MEDFKVKGKTILEIRTAKFQLERDILALVSKFEQENDVHVQYVNLDSIHMLKNPLPNTVKVQVEFKF